MCYNGGVLKTQNGAGASNTFAVSKPIRKGDFPMTYSDSTSPVFNSQSTYVYFISSGSTPIKIGISNNPNTRLSELQTAHYQRLHLLYTIECHDRAQAYELESAFHRWYGDLHVRNEWYNLTPKKIAADIQLLTTLANSMVSATQHITPAKIERMEQRAEQKISRQSGGGQTTDEITTVMVTAFEDADGIHANCPHCEREFVKPTPTSLRLALTAHLRGCEKRNNGKGI